MFLILHLYDFRYLDVSWIFLMTEVYHTINFPRQILGSAKDRPQRGLAAEFVREESGGRSATICENMNTEPGPGQHRPLSQLRSHSRQESTLSLSFLLKYNI